VEPASRIEVESNMVLSKSLSATNPVQLRMAQRPVRHRVQRLVELTRLLLREMEPLVCDGAFAEESSKLESLDIGAGIDFYSEVQKFETGLIKLALKQTGGNQARASKLLKIKPTTLNSKIKLYGIVY
jgi:DNA-binding NtrC family response regulator